MRKRQLVHLFMRKKGMYRSANRRRPPLSFQSALTLSFILFCVATLIGLAMVQWGIRPALIEIAKSETQRMGSLAINDAMSEKVLEDIRVDDLLKYEYDEQGRIQAVSWNTSIYHDVQYDTVKRVQSYLYNLEHGEVKDFQYPRQVDYGQKGASFTEEGFIYMIPLGQATNNIFFAHLGPKIPVRFSFIGDVNADIATSIVETGINNTYIEISLVIEAAVRVIIPFASDTTVVSTSIPIANFFHTGEIPEQYSEAGKRRGPAMIKPPSNVMIGELDLDDIINE